MKTRRLIFVRHAQSTLNKAIVNYFAIHKLGNDAWNNIQSDPDFVATISHNPVYIDAQLTEDGIKQCKVCKQKLKMIGFGKKQSNSIGQISSQIINSQSQKIQINHKSVVLVSPFFRALQTCQEIIDPGQIVIVHPLLREATRMSCDILSNKRKKYFPYDFNQMNEIESQQQALKKLMEGHSYEGDMVFKDRMIELAKYIIRLSEEYEEIMLVSHYFVVRQLLKGVKLQNGTILSDDIVNAEPYVADFDNFVSAFNQKLSNISLAS